MKKTTTLTLLGLCSLIILSIGCHFNSQYIDRVEDKKDAEKVTNLFYSYITNNNIDSIYGLCSNEFFKVNDTSAVKELILGVHEKLGEIQNISLHHWNTLVVKGSDPKSEYNLYYLVKYKEAESKETINLVKKDGEIKIIGYNINSDGLIK